jgi:leucyl aminopeptidase
MRHLPPPRLAVIVLFAGLTFPHLHQKVVAQDVKEQAIGTALGVAVRVRMEGPYTAETPLQVVCYFRYTPDGAKRMAGAPIELDKELGGVIAALRERGEFEGAELETLVLIPPKGSIRAKALLLIGLGEESSLSLERMKRVGRVALREASLLGARGVAFAPLIRDQGNTKLGAGAVEQAVVRGMLLAYDTHRRLQQEGLASDWTLDGWNVEAGPAYFAETVAGVTRGVAEANATAAARTTAPYTRKK